MLRPFSPLTWGTLVVSLAPLAAFSTQGPGNAAEQASSDQDTAPVRLPVVEQPLQLSMQLAKAPDPAATLEVLFDGRVAAGKQVLFCPTKSDDRKALRAWLKAAAEKMEKKRVPSAPDLDELPNGLLLLNCDASASMTHLQDLLSDCVAIEPPIWRIHLGTLRVKGKGDGASLVQDRLDLSLLDDAEGPATAGAESEPPKTPDPAAGPRSTAPPEPFLVGIRVKSPGRKLTVPHGEPWSGNPAEHYYYDRSERRLLFDWGVKRMTSTEDLRAALKALSDRSKANKAPLPPVVIDPRRDTTVSDAALVMEAAMSCGFRKFSFTQAQ